MPTVAAWAVGPAQREDPPNTIATATGTVNQVVDDLFTPCRGPNPKGALMSPHDRAFAGGCSPSTPIRFLISILPSLLLRKPVPSGWTCSTKQVPSPAAGQALAVRSLAMQPR